ADAAEVAIHPRPLGLTRPLGEEHAAGEALDARAGDARIVDERAAAADRAVYLATVDVGDDADRDAVAIGECQAERHPRHAVHEVERAVDGVEVPCETARRGVIGAA